MSVKAEYSLIGSECGGETGKLESGLALTSEIPADDLNLDAGGFSRTLDTAGKLLEAETGRQLLVVTGADDLTAAYAPDGKSLAILDAAGTLTVWDTPPRKPLTWFATAAVAIAVPVVLPARRRARRLRGLAGRAA